MAAEDEELDKDFEEDDGAESEQSEDSFFDDEEEEDYDPFDVDDFDIDQENMDDDNPEDTVDYPTMRNMPEEMSNRVVYTPEFQGSAKQAILSLFDHNPMRRPVMLEIINLCRDGCASSKVTEFVDEYQKDNVSVYSALTLCHMLERAGALTIEVPETTKSAESEEGDAEYLEITDKVDPIMTSTDAAKEVADEFAEGKEFQRIIVEHEAVYRDVYIAVMKLASKEEGCQIKEINNVVETFPIVKKPRRFGGHFVDMLERTDAMIWKNRAWHLTDFGQRMLAQMQKGEK